MSRVTRRDFLDVVKKVLAATGLTALLSPVIAFFYPPTLEETPPHPVQIGRLDDLPPGSGTTVPYGRYPALVIHTEEGVKAYSAVCTHFSCIVKWDQDDAVIYCPCHAGYFEPNTGEVISGPPPLPLDPLQVTIEDGEILIGGEA